MIDNCRHPPIGRKLEKAWRKLVPAADIDGLDRVNGRPDSSNMIVTFQPLGSASSRDRSSCPPFTLMIRWDFPPIQTMSMQSLVDEMEETGATSEQFDL